MAPAYDTWYCHGCGALNMNSSGVCPACGMDLNQSIQWAGVGGGGGSLRRPASPRISTLARFPGNLEKLSREDPRYHAHHQNLILHHPQPRAGPTGRHQNRLESTVDERILLDDTTKLGDPSLLVRNPSPSGSQPDASLLDQEFPLQRFDERHTDRGLLMPVVTRADDQPRIEGKLYIASDNLSQPTSPERFQAAEHHSDILEPGQTHRNPPFHSDATRHSWDEDEDEDDRQSIRSATSSTTFVSNMSGLTLLGFESATDELQKIFQDDADFARLYRLALKDVSIGPERLQRNLSRMLQHFAQDLHREASGELEKKAPRFIRDKAQYVAQCIVEEFHTELVSSPVNKDHDKGPDLNAFPIHPRLLEDLGDFAPVDEDEFEDLATLRKFLVHSTAFHAFRTRLTEFVEPKKIHSSQSADKEVASGTPSTYFIRLSDVIRHTVRAILVTSELLEPPLQQGNVRIRWRCQCGSSFFGDVTEYRDGGASKIVERMRRTCATVTATSYSEGSSNQAFTSVPINFARATISQVSNAFRRSSRASGGLPQHSKPDVVGDSADADIGMESLESLLLLAGLHQSQRRTYLAQDHVENLKTDRELFTFMKQQLDSRYSRAQRLFTTKRVKDIHITKLRLRMGNNLEVRTHQPCCTYNAWSKCECIPPEWKVEGGLDPEYRCQPAGPLDYGPPVLSQYLVHRLEDPSCIHEEDDEILKQIPKHLRDGIKAEVGKAVEGWGLYYEECANLRWIAVLTVTVFCLTGLLFGILWGVLKDDLQGAFGVSGFLAAVCAISVPMFAWAQNS